VRILECKQNSAEWLEHRRGRITASRIVDVLNFTKKKVEGASRRNYRIELLAERLSGRVEDHYVSPEMKWGQAFENSARSAYEMKKGEMVELVGFVLHPEFDFSGASPDGLIGKDGCLELKCPKTTTHLRWMMAGTIPDEHLAQCLWVMNCTERAYCDFASYDPRLPEGLRLFTVRMHRDEDLIRHVEAEVANFNTEIEDCMADLRKRVTAQPEPISNPVGERSDYEQLMEMMDQVDMTP
jgi:putative phage-type endonuclease